MAASKTLLERLLAGREAMVDLPGGKAVRVRRPAEVEMPRLLLEGDLPAYLACVCDWPGWTEADVLGHAGGSDAPAAFDHALWLEVAKDRTDWCKAVADKLKAMCADHMQARESASGN